MSSPAAVMTSLLVALVLWSRCVPRTCLGRHRARLGEGVQFNNPFADLILAAAGIYSQRGVKKHGKGRQFKTLGFHSLRHTFVLELAMADIRDHFTLRYVVTVIVTTAG